VTAAIRDHSQALALLSPDASPIEPRALKAQPALREIEVLRSDLDLVAPPDAIADHRSLVDLYRGESTSGDSLRLPLLTNHDGPSLRAALARVLDADTSAGGPNEGVLKEERMRRVLCAIQDTVSNIQQRSTLRERT
jgi:hypothetical protein